MRHPRHRPSAALFAVLLCGIVAGCGSVAGDERRNGVSRDEAEAVARRLVCPGEEARRVVCEPARGGWSCVYGTDRKTVIVAEPNPETGRLC